MQKSKSAKWVSWVIIIFGWFALIAQFYLIILNRVASVAETIIRYFSFFTILTNLLVALCFTFLLSKSKWKLGIFFSKPTTQTAVTVYILIVGIVYNLILRFLWQPKGLQLIVDELLHTVIPVLCVFFWWRNVNPKILNWKDAFPWLIYPLVYIFLILILGAISGFYPYPFIDVNTIGYARVLINSGILAICFLGVSFLFIAIGKRSHNKHLFRKRISS
ncbi:MAG TPA: Pr6Pr family membrane protein [Hanamia sp.]|nr:Pr6Pr family membrane protein [Hanamia sp.]